MITVSEEIKVLIKAVGSLSDFEILYCEYGRDGEPPIYRQFRKVELKNIDNEPKLILHGDF